MVLVGMRYDQGVDAPDDAPQGLGVGNEGIHAARVAVGEGDACIDQDPASVMAVECPVHADAAEAANRHNNDLGRPRTREPMKAPQ